MSPSRATTGSTVAHPSAQFIASQSLPDVFLAATAEISTGVSISPIARKAVCGRPVAARGGRPHLKPAGLDGQRIVIGEAGGTHRCEPRGHLLVVAPIEEAFRLDQADGRLAGIVAGFRR